MSTTDHSGECPICEEYPESFGCAPREKGDDCKHPRTLAERLYTRRLATELEAESFKRIRRLLVYVRTSENAPRNCVAYISIGPGGIFSAVAQNEDSGLIVEIEGGP